MDKSRPTSRHTTKVAKTSRASVCRHLGRAGGEVFIAGMARALPSARREDLYWGFHFLVGAMTMIFAETGRIDVLSGGLCRGDDLEATYARLVPFMAAGYRALIGE